MQWKLEILVPYRQTDSSSLSSVDQTVYYQSDVSYVLTEESQFAFV